MNGLIKTMLLWRVWFGLNPFVLVSLFDRFKITTPNVDTTFNLTYILFDLSLAPIVGAQLPLNVEANTCYFNLMSEQYYSVPVNQVFAAL